MPGMALVVALAAQAATQGGAATAPPTQASSSTKGVGQSTYVDLEAGVGYSTNPLQSLNNNNGAAYGRISAHAVHTRVTDRTTTVLAGFAQGLFYTRHHGTEESFDVTARHDASVNEKLRLYVDGDAAYDKNGQLQTQILTVPLVPLLPGTIIPPTLLSPGGDFLTVRGRNFTVRADAGGQLALTARDSLDFSAGVEHDSLKSGTLDTRFTSVPLSLGYDRQLNARTTIGARVVGQFTHYSGDLNNGVADSQVITPELTAQLRLSETFTFSGDVGASFSSVNDGLRTHHSTGLTAAANLCSTTERSTFCGHAAIQQQAATVAGPARDISVGLDYSRQLTANDTLQLAVDADRFSNPIVVVSGQSFRNATSARAVLNYSRKISDRWFGGVNLAARKITETGPDPDADLSASLFVRYRFGDVR